MHHKVFFRYIDEMTMKLTQLEELEFQPSHGVKISNFNNFTN